MIKKFINISLILLTSSCFASSKLKSVEGKYNCRGTELDGTSFHCEMLIKKTGETYASKAQCDDGIPLRGNGIYIKKINAIASAFGEPKRKGEPGITLSYLKNDGTMYIDWIYLNSTKIGHTFCTKVT